MLFVHRNGRIANANIAVPCPRSNKCYQRKVLAIEMHYKHSHVFIPLYIHTIAHYAVSGIAIVAYARKIPCRIDTSRIIAAVMQTCDTFVNVYKNLKKEKSYEALQFLQSYMPENISHMFIAMKLHLSLALMLRYARGNLTRTCKTQLTVEMNLLHYIKKETFLDNILSASKSDFWIDKIYFLRNQFLDW